MSLVHLHLLLNHVPVIGIVFVALVLLAALRMQHGGDVSRLGLLLLVGVGAVAAAVYFTGEPAEDAVERIAGVSRAVIHQHEEAAEAAFIGAAITAGFALLALFRYRRRELPRAVTGAMLVFTLVVSGLMAWTANLGGQIRHSEIRTTTTQADGEVDR